MAPSIGSVFWNETARDIIVQKKHEKDQFAKKLVTIASTRVVQQDTSYYEHSVGQAYRECSLLAPWRRLASYSARVEKKCELPFEADLDPGRHAHGPQARVHLTGTYSNSQAEPFCIGVPRAVGNKAGQ